MDEFTNDEKNRITELYGNDFADATPDDFQLIKRWETAKARLDAENSERNTILREEMEARIEMFQDQTRHAMNALDELKEAALSRLKAVEADE